MFLLNKPQKNSPSTDSCVYRANQSELQFLGYSSDEYIGRSIVEFHADQAIIKGLFSFSGFPLKLLFILLIIVDILARLTRGERLVD